MDKTLLILILLHLLLVGYDTLNNEPNIKALFINKSFLIHLFVFYIMVIPLTIIDYYKIYPFYKYKIKPQTLTLNLLYNTWKLVFKNQLLIPIISWLLYPFMNLSSTFYLYELLYLLPFFIIEEIFFYLSHRILHYPFFYKHIHKIHHEWVYPIALSCIYSHPLEFIFSNLLPTILCLLLFNNISIYFYWLWMTIGFINTVLVHAGYTREKEYPLHFYHHVSFNYNYGVSLFMDKLMGTHKTKIYLLQ